MRVVGRGVRGGGVGGGGEEGEDHGDQGERKLSVRAVQSTAATNMLRSTDGMWKEGSVEFHNTLILFGHKF